MTRGRTYKPKWGSEDPRPINQQRPQLDPETGLPPVGEGLDTGLNRQQRRARAKQQRRARPKR